MPHREARTHQGENGEVAGKLQVRYSDIDINGHVNSIKYIEHILDLFPMDMLRGRGIRRFEMAYVAESFYGDWLTFTREEVRPGEYDIEVKKNQTEVVVRSKVLFNAPASVEEVGGKKEE